MTKDELEKELLKLKRELALLKLEYERLELGNTIRHQKLANKELKQWLSNSKKK